MATDRIVPASPEFSARAAIRGEDYTRLYAQSLDEPERFWGEVAQRLEWITPPTRIKDVSYDLRDFRIRWYSDGELNLAVNCLDRHLADRGHKTALLWEGDDPSESRHISYRELHRMVCELGNALRHLGVKKGDRVTLYLPMIPEAAVAMLACARIGAVHSVVFGGFSPESLAGRIADCGSRVVITADESLRGGKHVPLKANVDEALRRDGTQCVETVLVVKRSGRAVPMQMPRDRWYSAVVEGQPATCEPERMNAEDPLFILYTSGSTGKPKGVLHTTGGYAVYTQLHPRMRVRPARGRRVLVHRRCGLGDRAQLCAVRTARNGATSLMFEGVPNHPDTSRFWEVSTSTGSRSSTPRPPRSAP
jgi:acetyl-CoA synthetase